MKTECTKKVIGCRFLEYGKNGRLHTAKEAKAKCRMWRVFKAHYPDEHNEKPRLILVWGDK